MRPGDRALRFLISPHLGLARHVLAHLVCAASNFHTRRRLGLMLSTHAFEIHGWAVIQGGREEGGEAKGLVCASPVSLLVLVDTVHTHLEFVTSSHPFIRLRNSSETRPSCQGQDADENIMRISAIFTTWECAYLASAQVLRVSRTRLYYSMFACASTGQDRPNLQATCPAHLAFERSMRCWEIIRGRFRAH